MIIDLSYGPEEEVGSIEVEEMQIEEVEGSDISKEALEAHARELNNGFFAQQLQYANTHKPIGVVVGYTGWYDLQEKEEVEHLRAQRSRFQPLLNEES